MLSFRQLREANATRQSEWDPGNKITIEYRGNELAGEVGEACNLIKKLARERMGIRGTRASLDEIAAELADVIIATDLVAMSLGIDLDVAVTDKFNKTTDKYQLKTKIK
jgi:NTP pyrophosphatase (non-canonical NTP hydrolase)